MRSRQICRILGVHREMSFQEMAPLQQGTGARSIPVSGWPWTMRLGMPGLFHKGKARCCHNQVESIVDSTKLISCTYPKDEWSCTSQT